MCYNNNNCSNNDSRNDNMCINSITIDIIIGLGGLGGQKGTAHV